jgi:hypothetical protein
VTVAPAPDPDGRLVKVYGSGNSQVRAVDGFAPVASLGSPPSRRVVT